MSDETGTLTAGTVRAPDFGTLTAPAFARPASGKGRFRIAVPGDFSGRANRGALETGEALAARKPQKLDVDTLDTVIGRFATTLTLPVGPGGESVEIGLRAIDQPHPDELVNNLDLFSELTNLRGMVKSGARRTMSDLAGRGEEFGHPKPKGRSRRKAGGVPADRRLPDFRTLIRATRPAPTVADTDDLIRRIVGPPVVEADSSDKPAMLAAVDEPIPAAMRRVLHHPDFQTLEAGWRTLDMLARRIETDATLRIAVHDVAAEELAADLAAGGDLSETGLHAMLAEKPLEDAAQGAYGAIIGLHIWEETPPHAERLGRMAKIAAHIGAPFFSAIAPGFMEVRPEDRHPLVKAAWDGPRALPEAKYPGLATPRFLLRHPCGKRSDPIDSFAFEEFTLHEGLGGMLMANPAALVAVLLAATMKTGGRTPEPGTVMTLDDIPFHVITDADGDPVALPCTERLLSEAAAAAVVGRGYMPVLSVRVRNVVRLGSWTAVGGGTVLGPWDQGLACAGAAGVSVALGAGLAAAEAPARGGRDDDLDALLAGLGGDDSSDDDGEMDPDLAALLKDL